MKDDAAGFVGDIPHHYDQGMGPMIFVDYAADVAQRVAACNPIRVLETAAGTGIVTRRLRDRLPAGVGLTATDLNPPMLEIARAKFRPGEDVEFKAADAMELPFADGSFDAVVCQFGVMFYPDKDKSYREVYRVRSDWVLSQVPSRQTSRLRLPRDDGRSGLAGTAPLRRGASLRYSIRPQSDLGSVEMVGFRPQNFGAEKAAAGGATVW